MPAMTSAKGFRRHATFEDGPRRPLTPREKAAIGNKIEIEGLQGRLTPLHVRVLLWVLGSVGYDGRCDPSNETIAQATGSSPATVKRAKARAIGLGILTAKERIVRVGARVLQRTSAYLFPTPRASAAQSEPEPESSDSDSSFLARLAALGRLRLAGIAVPDWLSGATTNAARSGSDSPQY